MTSDTRHGGALDLMRTAYPDAPQPWIDLSTGLNPWPYPDLMLSAEALAHLPTQQMYDACRDAMASAFGGKPDTLILSPGSELQIRLLPDVITPRSVAILSPTYGDHAEAWTQAGADVIETPDPLSYTDEVDAIVITNPNNPDGRLFDPEALDAARIALNNRGGWLIIDEAYADLMPEYSIVSGGGADGLVILRSFGKFFGLAGLRLGALIASEPVLKAMANRLGVWPVSGAALQIGARAYADIAWQDQTRDKLKAAMDRLDTILKSVGLSTVGGTSLFRLIETPNAHVLFDQLARAGIYVRRFETSKTHLRIGLPPNPEAEARLAAALSL
ncbi:MAG: threonine-phosphate decarboxylase CobD [Pseudomonadota bacterium]